MHPLSTIADAHAETLLLPDTDAELREVVRQLHSDGQAWTPAGLATRLDWSAPLQNAGPSLSVQRLKGVIDHAVDDLTITVQAGLPLMELQRLLAEQQQWLPVDWPWGSCSQTPTSAGTVGGLVARGLSGSLRQRHMGVRDQLIGIGLLRSDGVTARAGGRVVKNVAGYDLMRLLCGSWGSLALITQLTLRVKPISPASGLLIVHGALEQQECFRAALMQSSLTPERCDWQKPGEDEGWRLRLLISSINAQAVDDQLKRLEQLAQDHGLSYARHDSRPPCETGLAEQNGPWLVRVVLPPAKLQRLLNAPALRQLNGWQWDLAAGHGCGDGWSTSASPAYQVSALRQDVTRLGGFLSVLKQPQGSEIAAWLDAPSRPLIEAVKRQFDPQWQLCRGRLPGVHQPVA